jgi:hypothetical protein
MPFRRTLALTGLALVAFAAVSPADQPRAAAGRGEPTFVAQLQPLEQTLSDFQYLAGLAGQEEFGRQAEGFFKALGGAGGSVAGIDTRRPFGVYAILTPGGIDSPVVAMLPVADEAAVLTLLEQQFQLKPKKDETGLYTVQVPNVPLPVLFRFANRYAYVTAQNAGNIDPAKLLPPERVLNRGEGLLSASLFIDRIPDNYKQIALSQLELKLADAKEARTAGDTPAHARLKATAADALAADVKSLLRDGTELRLRLGLDRRAGEFAADLSLNGRPGSRLASDLAGLGNARSLFGALAAKDAALNFGLTVALPDRLREALGPVIDELTAKAAADEKDAGKRHVIEAGGRAWAPTFKSAELDLGASLRGPDAGGQFTALVGLKVVNGKGIEKFTRDLLAQIPEADRPRATFDVAKVGDSPVHRVDLGKHLDANGRRVLGDNPLFVAFRDDAVILAIGPDGLPAARDALTPAPETAPLLRLGAAIDRLARAAPPQDPFRKAAQEAFAQGKPGDGATQLRITGTETGLTVQARASTGLVKLIAALIQQKVSGKKD